MSYICLNAELDWINNNLNRYINNEHASNVKINIYKRYVREEVKSLIKESKIDDIINDDLSSLFKYFNISTLRKVKL